MPSSLGGSSTTALRAAPDEEEKGRWYLFSSPLLDGGMENISFENIPYGSLHAAHRILYRDDPKGTARIWQKMCSAIITWTCVLIILEGQRELEVIKSCVSVVSFLEDQKAIN